MKLAAAVNLRDVNVFFFHDYQINKLMRESWFSLIDPYISANVQVIKELILLGGSQLEIALTACEIDLLLEAVRTE